jgi:phenylalanyl-tRNA synthetase beta chain
LNNRFYDNISLFEIGSTYLKEIKGLKVSDKQEQYLPLQDKWLAGILQEKNNNQPFYIVKNIVAALLNRLHFDYKLIKNDQVPAFAKKSRSVKIMINDQELGYISELADSLYKKLDLEIRLSFFEINLTKLAELYSDEFKYKQIPKFPSIDLDISMIIDKNILWEEVQNIVKQTDNELIRQVTFFDVYEGQGISVGKKSIAFRIEYRSDNKTLTMVEAQVIHNKVIKNLENKLGGQIRK